VIKEGGQTAPPEDHTWWRIICTWCCHQQEFDVFTLTSSSGHIVTAHRPTSAFLAAGEWRAGANDGSSLTVVANPALVVNESSVTRQWPVANVTAGDWRPEFFHLPYDTRVHRLVTTRLFHKHLSVSLAVITTTSRSDCHYAQKRSGLTSHTKNPPNTRP